MANLEWTPGSTPQSLGSSRPDPANRFFEWKPDYEPTGDVGVTLAGVHHRFDYRVDYTLGIKIKHLTSDQLSLALELKQWLMNGGTVTVNTDDLDDASYDDVRLAAGTKPEIENDNDDEQLFTFSVMLASDEEMTINYG